MKFLTDIIHEQNRLLEIAADTIDRLVKENNDLQGLINPDSIRNIKNILWDKDLDVAKLARKIGKSRTWTSLVLYGIKQSGPTRQAIAGALGVAMDDLWNNHKRAA